MFKLEAVYFRCFSLFSADFVFPNTSLFIDALL